MKQEREPQGTRRQLLIAPALSLLQNPKPPQYQWRSDQEEERTPFEERQNIPLLRDVIRYGNTYYLIGRDRVYPMTPSGFEEYRYKSFFNERGRRVFVNQGVELLDLPRGKLINEEVIYEDFTGAPKFTKNKGGVINVFIMGSFSDQGVLYDITPTIELFPAIRGEEGLGALGWTDLDSFFFLYGKRGIDAFTPADTVKDPQEIFRDSDEFMDYLEETFPFCQINLFEHSWGVVIGQRMAQRYAHMINARVSIAGPTRGINKKGRAWIPPGIPIHREFAADIFRTFLRVTGIDERMTTHLFSIWNDKGYQKELDEFPAQFRGAGKILLDLTSVDDLIVPVESTLLRGKVNELNGRRIPSAWKLLLDKPKDPKDALIRHH